MQRAAVGEGPSNEGARRSGGQAEVARVVDGRRGCTAQATVRGDVERAAGQVVEGVVGRQGQVAATPSSAAAIVQGPSERHATAANGQHSAAANGRRAGAAHGAVGPIQGAVHREIARASQNALGNQEIEMSTGIDHACTANGQSSAVDGQGLRAAGTTNTNGARRRRGACRHRDRVGAVVGDESVVRRARHLGRSPIAGGVPIAGAADPDEVGGVRGGRGQECRADNGRPFLSFRFHELVVLCRHPPRFSFAVREGG